MPAPADNGINLAHGLRDEAHEITEAMEELWRLLSERTQFYRDLSDERTEQLAYAWAQADSSYQLDIMAA